MATFKIKLRRDTVEYAEVVVDASTPHEAAVAVRDMRNLPWQQFHGEPVVIGYEMSAAKPGTRLMRTEEGRVLVVSRGQRRRAAGGAALRLL